jgi:hypothetical protein
MRPSGGGWRVPDDCKPGRAAGRFRADRPCLPARVSAFSNFQSSFFCKGLESFIKQVNFR